MSFCKDTPIWFWVAMLLLLLLIVRMTATTFNPSEPFTLTQQRMEAIKSLVFDFASEHGEFPENLQFIKKITSNHSLLSDGWGHPIHYTVTNGIVTLTCHINEGNDEILMHRFPIMQKKDLLD